MKTVGQRLREIRKNAKLTQVEIGKRSGFTQTSVNRYETDNAAAPYRYLIWVAQEFSVSMDYIFGLTDNPHGCAEAVEMAAARESAAAHWEEFVEACFEPGSEPNRKLKQMLIGMRDEQFK